MSALYNRQAGIFRWPHMHAVGLSLGLAGIVFLADLFTPLGVASSVPYSLAILLALKTSSRRYAVAFAILCSILTVSDLYLGPGRAGSELSKVFTNGFLAVSMIWMTLTLGVMRKYADQRREQAEERTLRHLADLAHMGRVNTAGQLAATLAHELNQPLAVISFQSEVASQLVLRNGTPDPPLLDALSEVTEQSHRAAGIIRGVGSFVRKSEPQWSLVQLNDVVREMARLIDSQVRQAEINLELRLSSIPLISGDSIQLEQVLLNLLQNALDAVEGGRHGLRRVVVETVVSGDGSVLCYVRDSGVGLEANQVEQVFERFYSTKPKGMGMGLAISRSIIESHGGRLWNEPNPDLGAIFSFSLPRAS